MAPGTYVPTSRNQTHTESHSTSNSTKTHPHGEQSKTITETRTITDSTTDNFTYAVKSVRFEPGDRSATPKAPVSHATQGVFTNTCRPITKVGEGSTLKGVAECLLCGSYHSGCMGGNVKFQAPSPRPDGSLEAPPNCGSCGQYHEHCKGRR